MNEWLTDANGNRCSVEYFGSREAAQTALDSLKSCENCVNCSGCSRCSDCSHIAFLWDKTDLKGDPSAAQPAGPPQVPVIEGIHQKVYAAASAPAALDMGCWHHSCGTTHCRAGWVVHLAGEAGYALERFFNTELAALKIYDASSNLPKVSPVYFYDGNKAALVDMKRMADLEAAAP